MKTSNKFKKVSINLSSKSISNIEELSALLEENNRTRVVSSALEVAKAIMKQVTSGKHIILRNDDGTEREMSFIIT